MSWKPRRRNFKSSIFYGLCCSALDAFSASLFSIFIENLSTSSDMHEWSCTFCRRWNKMHPIPLACQKRSTLNGAERPHIFCKSTSFASNGGSGEKNEINAENRGGKVFQRKLSACSQSTWDPGLKTEPPKKVDARIEFARRQVRAKNHVSY